MSPFDQYMASVRRDLPPWDKDDGKARAEATGKIVEACGRACGRPGIKVRPKETIIVT